MSSEEKDISIIQLRVTVSSAAAHGLYEALLEIRPYYRSRRLVQLALLGLSVEKSSPFLVAPMQSAAQLASPQRPTNEAAAPVVVAAVESASAAPHYIIPDVGSDSMDALEGMLGKY